MVTIKGPNIAPTLALTVVALTLVITIVVLGIAVPFKNPSAHDLLMAAYGFSTALLKDAWGYFFGTTRGSETKTQMLANSTPNQPAPSPEVQTVVLPPEPARADVSLDGTPFK